MAIKRSREDQHKDFESSIAMANYLILLSTGTGLGLDPGSTVQTSGRVFECKTCSRRFPSFQALGGHRASHKKPRPSDGPELTMVMGHDDNNQAAHNGGKPKAHECSICGQEFAVGQALGGHMRRHRADLTGSQHLPLSLGTSHEARVNKGRRNGIKDDHDHHDHKRVKCLDLNLTPLENGLMEFGTVAPIFC